MVTAAMVTAAMVTAANDSGHGDRRASRRAFSRPGALALLPAVLAAGSLPGQARRRRAAGRGVGPAGRRPPAPPPAVLRPDAPPPPARPGSPARPSRRPGQAPAGACRAP